ncbi:MAG: VWA domain-containing protein [Chloroflexales bacterium]
MDVHPEQLTPEQLYDQALTFFRATRWDEAISALRQLQTQSDAYPEAETLLADIQLKQYMDRVQAPLALAPPREQPKRGPRIFVAVAALLSVGLISGVWFVSSRMPTLPSDLPAASRQSVIGALPTAAPGAPTSSVAVAPTGNGTLKVTQVQATAMIDNIYFILDASGSMNAAINGQTKINSAHEALGALVKDLDSQVNVALRTYGRNRTQDCTDIQLVSPLGPLHRDALLAQINAIRPVSRSLTPIARSLAAISADLKDAKGSTLVVLLSDGEESCDGDPVAEATRLRIENPKVRVSVVGFDIAAESQARLAAIAAAGGGSYFGAADVKQLSTALKQTLGLTYHVFDIDGHEVGHANVSESITLPAGSYRVTIGDNPALLEEKALDIRKDMVTLMSLSNDQGRLTSKISHNWVK